MANLVNAKGASGTNYTYFATDGWDWADVPANYMFARLAVGGWQVFYIGECESAKCRFAAHERWDEAVRVYGATHILTHTSSADTAVRRREERDLIQSHDPQMNVHHRPDAAPLRGRFG
jgi:hypothetical protein